jgi:hypothetical protein
MKKIILSAILVSSLSLAQHLPLKIGNQWHYDPTAVPGGTKYAAIVVDTTIINNKTYFKIERRKAFTGELLETTFDRLEGDSTYYRIKNSVESIIINFNWPEGFTRTTTTDSICFNVNLLWNITPGIFWGFTTDYYQFRFGSWCIGDPDTSWALFIYEITRLFGCRWAGDGRLEGAIIDGTTYGVLYPLPVELVSFTSEVIDNNITLNWTTATETNNQGFEILRLTQNDNDWQIISFITGHGTTTEPQFYSFTDEALQPGNYQYKLKQIDYDGSFEYSKIVEVTIEAPTKFSLSQNYPNPFNPSTNIEFRIADFGFVSLKVYDVLGNEVATLVDEEKPAGEYEVKFTVGQDSSPDISSGIYFYQLKVGSFVQTKKMMVLK